MSYDDYSMASVDPNPTFDQVDDGGLSSDFSSALQTAGVLGTEIASAVAGYQSSSQVSVYPSNNATPWAAPINAPKKNTAGIVLLAVVVAGGLWLISNAK